MHDSSCETGIRLGSFHIALFAVQTTVRHPAVCTTSSAEMKSGAYAEVWRRVEQYCHIRE
jgi:hypothetical protein